MSPLAVPTRITIDFRDSVHPSRTWILGLADSGRADLLAFRSDAPPALGDPLAAERGLLAPPVATTRPTALSAACTCPDFCERDHDID